MAGVISGDPTSDALETPLTGRAERVHVAPQPKEDSLALLKALAEGSAVFIALTFIGGWSYLASYYQTFGLNPLEFDISVPVVSTIAVYVLYKSVWPLIVAFALIVLFAVFAVRQRKMRRSQRVGRAPVVAALAVLLLTVAIAGTFHGRQIANQDILVDSATLPYVAFASKLKNLNLSCVDYETYGSMDCKLLLHHNNTYYFFKPVPKKGIGSLDLYMLPDSGVEGVHLQRGLDQSAKIE